jgi:hypothetical protein
MVHQIVSRGIEPINRVIYRNCGMNVFEQVITPYIDRYPDGTLNDNCTCFSFGIPIKNGKKTTLKQCSISYELVV